MQRELGSKGSAELKVLRILRLTRRSKIVSRAIATSFDHMPCAAVSFNFTGQSLRLPDECGPCDFGPVSTK